MRTPLAKEPPPGPVGEPPTRIPARIGRALLIPVLPVWLYSCLGAPLSVLVRCVQQSTIICQPPTGGAGNRASIETIDLP